MAAPPAGRSANGQGDDVNFGVVKTTDGGNTWSAVDSGLTDTYVFNLAIDPANRSTIYAGTESGASKTTTGGASWAAIDSHLRALIITTTTVDPASAATVYAGTDAAALWKSLDGGASWAAINAGLAGQHVGALAIDPAHPGAVYAGTEDGIFKSGDGGVSWSAINTGLSLADDPGFMVSSFALDPAHPGTVYASADREVWKTTNGGASWTPLNEVGRLVIDPVHAGTFYLADDRLSKSTDGGVTWVESDTGMLASEDESDLFIFDLKIDPTNTAVLYAATNRGFFVSRDAAATWTGSSCGLPSAAAGPFSFYLASALALDPRHPGTVYAAGTGVWKTVDSGVTWSDISGDLSGIAVTALTFDAGTSTLYAGTAGRSVFAFTDSGKPAPPPSVLCIDEQPGDARFTVRVQYQTQQAGGAGGAGRAISLASVGVTHGGLFWFFDAANPEMLVKVINGCAVNNKHWLFYAAGTNVGLTTTVADTFTGGVRVYTNPDRTAAPPVQDTGAFNCLEGPDFAPDPPLHEAPAPTAEAPTSTPAAACMAGPTTLCIGERFKVEVAYQTSQGGGQAGKGQAIALDSLGVDRGGLFWFFSPDNPEMLIKVIDGCALTGRYWVFYSAGTNVGLHVTVTDTQTGRAAVYANPDLTAAPPVQDTGALPCS